MSHKDGKKQTGIERLENAFAVCKAEGRRAVSPFITAGDPDSETTVAILKSISTAGATCCELGVSTEGLTCPSDPGMKDIFAWFHAPICSCTMNTCLKVSITISKVFRLVHRHPEFPRNL